MDTFKTVSAAFWSNHVWLPPNVTWNDIASTEKNQYTDYRHLILPLPLALVVLFIRFIFEKFCFEPLGSYIGITSSRTKRAVPNAILEKAFNKKHHKVLSHKDIVAIGKQLDWTERQVERWLRLRKSQDKPSTLTKFCENSWRCLYYTFSFIFGLIVLWDKPWLWDINHCFYNHPYHPVDDKLWWYYIISMAFYWSLNISQFFDNKRKDFWQMFIHHIATITLMYVSWICNLTRIGSLVLLVHDCADILLEAAKMAKYANYQKVCDFISVIFAVLWIVTRIGIYPFWIIRSTSIEGPKIVPMFPAYYILNSLLILLLGLHMIWTYLILKVAYNAFYAGQTEGDIRSDSSDDVSDSPNVTSSNSNHVGRSNLRQKEN